MDKKYLEFWGNLFLQAARSQGLMEELAGMSKQGFALAETQMSLFKKFYGLEDPAEQGPAKGEGWQNSFPEFMKSYRDFLELLAVVPKKDYDELAAKYEALRKEIAEKEEKTRVSEPGAVVYDQADLVKGVQDLLKTQSEQYQELMKAFGESYTKEKAKGKSKTRKSFRKEEADHEG